MYAWLVTLHLVGFAVFLACHAVSCAPLAGSGSVARLDDEALLAHLQTRRPEVLAAIGVSGLLALIVLMTVKPALW